MQQDLHSRLRSLEARLDRVKSLWGNDEAYADIVASGRYMKLCGVTGDTAEAVDQAANADDLDRRRGAEKRSGD